MWIQWFVLGTLNSIKQYCNNKCMCLCLTEHMDSIVWEIRKRKMTKSLIIYSMHTLYTVFLWFLFDLEVFTEAILNVQNKISPCNSDKWTYILKNVFMMVNNYFLKLLVTVYNTMYNKKWSTIFLVSIFKHLNTTFLLINSDFVS